jgi:hypothetical protein
MYKASDANAKAINQKSKLIKKQEKNPKNKYTQ